MIKNLSKREKLIYTTLVSTILAILLLSVITDVYARYSSTIYGNGDIELAKWEFKANEKGVGEEFDLNIVTDGNVSKISPNSTGYMQIKLENNSNVPAEAIISLRETFLNTNDETNTLKIYLDNSYASEKMIDITSKNLAIKLNAESSKTIKLYWKWVENESVDQTIAEYYDGFTISATVVGEQTEIGENENMELRVVDKE